MEGMTADRPPDLVSAIGLALGTAIMVNRTRVAQAFFRSVFSTSSAFALFRRGCFIHPCRGDRLTSSLPTDDDSDGSITGSL